MTDLERLTALLDNAPADPAGNRNVRTLAEYLLANGVVVPPCKVGDTVYAFSGDFSVVLPYFVEYLRIGFMDKNRNYWIYEANCHAEETDELLDELDFDLEDIGKTVFLSSEEAERALKGGAKE